MSHEPISQDTALRFQLGAIIGQSQTGYVELRWRQPTGGMGRSFAHVADCEHAVRMVGTLKGSTDVYVGAAPRSREAGTADAVEHVWTLWADLDGPDTLARLAKFEPLPSIVIRTGGDGCRHAYWPLSAPLPPVFAVRANRRLALALGADRNATDAARILRPAGTFSHKYQPRRPVICTRLEHRKFTAAEVVGGLADDPAYTRPATRSTTTTANAGATLDGLARVVRSAAMGERNERLNWAAFRAAEHQLAPATVEDALLAAAVEVGLSEREALRTIASGYAAGSRQAA